MIRKALAIIALAIASPALADTIPIVPGTLTVHQGDTIVTSKPLLDKPNAAGLMVHPANVAWRDYASLGWFTLSGNATTLKPLSALKGPYVKNGYSYQVMDGTPVVVPPPVVTAPPEPTDTLYGVNLSGGEFANEGNGQFLPTPADLDAYHAVGYNLFRIPFKTTEVAAAPTKLAALAAECVKLKVPCIFDRHEYAWPSVADQIAFWVPVAKLLGPAAQLDLENEPSGFTGNGYQQWAADSQAIVTGLRAAGVTNRIWLEWAGSSGTQRFDKGERAPHSCNSAACGLAQLPGGTINDPLHLTGLEGHRYFDTNGSGTSSNCDKWTIIQSAATQAVPFGMPFMIGEAALGNSATGMPTSCAALAPSVMAEIKASPNLYGVTWWGGGYKQGQVWGNYQFRILPVATSAYIKMTTGN